MAVAFFLLFAVSVVGLVVGLIKPSLIKLKSRKHVAYIFGTAIVVFFFATGIAGETSSDKSAPQPDAPQQVVASASSSPIQTTVATSSTPTSTMPLSASETLQMSDQFYFSQLAYGNVVIDFQYTGQDLTKIANDLQSYDYSAAITDMQAVQSDLERCENDLQYADSYAPFTPDVARIDTLANAAVSEGLKGASIAITDMENANYGGVNTVAMPYFTQMENDFVQAQELVAGYKAKNQQ